MAKKKNDERETDDEGELCAFFFKGGKNEVRERLAKAVRDAREQRNMSQEELDGLCFFKEDKLPTCAHFESEPSKNMNHEVFCRAASVLGLSADGVLDIKLKSKKLRQRVVATMEANKGGLVAAVARKAKEIPDDEVAPVYAVFKVLSEI